MSEQYILENYKTGDFFTAHIHGDEVTGKIFIGKGEESSTRDSVYFCQNERCGSTAEDKLGYEYSWVFDDNITNLVITPVSPIINQYEIF